MRRNRPWYDYSFPRPVLSTPRLSDVWSSLPARDGVQHWTVGRDLVEQPTADFAASTLYWSRSHVPTDITISKGEIFYRTSGALTDGYLAIYNLDRSLRLSSNSAGLTWSGLTDAWAEIGFATSVIPAGDYYFSYLGVGDVSRPYCRSWASTLTAMVNRSCGASGEWVAYNSGPYLVPPAILPAATLTHRIVHMGLGTW